MIEITTLYRRKSRVRPPLSQLHNRDQCTLEILNLKINMLKRIKAKATLKGSARMNLSLLLTARKNKMSRRRFQAYTSSLLIAQVKTKI